MINFNTHIISTDSTHTHTHTHTSIPNRVVDILRSKEPSFQVDIHMEQGRPPYVMEAHVYAGNLRT